MRVAVAGRTREQAELLCLPVAVALIRRDVLEQHDEVCGAGCLHRAQRVHDHLAEGGGVGGPGLAAAEQQQTLRRDTGRIVQQHALARGAAEVLGLHEPRELPVRGLVEARGRGTELAAVGDRQYQAAAAFGGRIGDVLDADVHLCSCGHGAPAAYAVRRPRRGGNYIRGSRRDPQSRFGSNTTRVPESRSCQVHLSRSNSAHQ